MSGVFCSGDAGESVTFVDLFGLVFVLSGGIREGLEIRIGFPSFCFLAAVVLIQPVFCLLAPDGVIEFGILVAGLALGTGSMPF